MPRGQDDDPAPVEVGQRPAADERLGDLVHADRGHEPGLAALALERVLQGQAVDHRGRHAHVVGGRLLDHVGAAAQAARRGGCCRPPRRSPAGRPRAATREACRAIRLTSSTLIPPSPGRQKLSPESLSRTRRKTGVPAMTLEIHEAGSSRVMLEIASDPRCETLGRCRMQWQSDVGRLADCHRCYRSRHGDGLSARRRRRTGRTGPPRCSRRCAS